MKRMKKVNKQRRSTSGNADSRRGQHRITHDMSNIDRHTAMDKGEERTTPRKQDALSGTHWQLPFPPLAAHH